MFDEPTLMRQDHVEKQGQRKLPRTRLQDRTADPDTADQAANRAIGTAGDAAHQGEPQRALTAAAKLSEAFELAPGDIIYSGTPENVGPVVKDDIMEGHIDKLPNISVKVV